MFSIYLNPFTPIYNTKITQWNAIRLSQSKTDSNSVKWKIHDQYIVKDVICRLKEIFFSIQIIREISYSTGSETTKTVGLNFG